MSSRRSRTSKPTKLTDRKKRAAPVVSLPKPSPDIHAIAYEKLGVTREEVASAPRMGDVLKHLKEGSRSGEEVAIGYLRGSDEKDALKWLQVYDSIPATYRNVLPIEAYGVAAGLTTRRVLELVMGACFEQSSMAAEIIARVAHPDIVKATVETARIPGREGVADRKSLHLHTGFVPVPKTQVMNVRGNFNQDNRTQIGIGELSLIEEKRARITDRFNQRLGIGDGSLALPPIPIDGADVTAPTIADVIPQEAENAPDPDWVL